MGVIEKSTILVVDDNPINLDVMVDCLERSGATILVARDGESALEKVNYGQPDIILLDVMMPGLDGFETCRRLKAANATKHIPVIFMTALNGLADKIKGFQAGGVDYITKPIQTDELLARLTTHLRLGNLTRELQWELAERERTEAALRKSEAHIRLIIDNILDAVVTIDAQGQIIAWNPQATAIFGWSQKEAIGQFLAETIIPVQYREAHRRGLAHYLATREGPILNNRIEIMALHRKGHQFPIELTVTPLFDENKILFSAFIRDITQQQQTQEQLYHRAFHDALTGLPNRALFINHLERVIESAHENEDYLFAVLFLDLDRFKVINDSLGHLAGDQLLITIAHRLETSVRPDDIVARLGGDEFAILLDGIPDIDKARDIATHIGNELSRPINLNGQEVFTTVSIGITTNQQAYLMPGDILRDADTAMYRAKTQGKARYELFEVEQHTQVVGRLQLETDLWQALERQELDVYYQPIISATSGQIISVEALLRWRHPQRGLLSPQEFILLAEEIGLIIPIGEWLLWKVCAQIKNWRVSGYPSLSVTVNMSARQLQQQNVISLLTEVLREADLPAQALVLEITEGSLTKALNPAMLDDLAIQSLKISLDNFGIGSSFECLKKFPLNILKIDKSFVRDITTNSHDQAIIIALIGLAHALNLTVIAEGVETETQLAFLQQHQCDGVQGYLFSKPMQAGDLTKLLQQGPPYPLRLFQNLN